MKTIFGRKAFTLVELIVVITIIAILGTIGFMSVQGYAKSARDSARLTDISNVAKALSVRRAASGGLPTPSAAVEATAGTGYSIVQWSIGPSVFPVIKMGETRDVLDGSYYTYATNSARTKFAVAAFFEDTAPLAASPYVLAETAYATDYSGRQLASKGDPTIAILTESGANGPLPIEMANASGTVIDLWTTSKTGLSLALSSTSVFSGTGELIGTVQSLVSGGSFDPPAKCPTGFVPVPGNAELGQPGFCVAKYEMSYADADAPDSTGGGTDWNTMHYVGTSKTIVSMANKYPIADITQPQAIDACQRAGYHLVTNREWLTVARDAESVGDNRSSGIVGNGGMFRGITGEGNGASSLGCDTASSTEKGPRAYVARAGMNTGKFGTAKQADCDSKRYHRLSNGSVVYDLAGNVWEHVNKMDTIDGIWHAAPAYRISDACGGVNNWASFSGNDGVAACAYSNGYSYASQGPKTPNLNANNGIGRIYSYSTANDVFFRGGLATYGAYAGLFTLLLSCYAGDASRYVGFRCAR